MSGRNIRVLGLIICFVSMLFLGQPTSYGADLVSIQVLTVNDFHGALIENGKNPGMAKVAQYLLDAKSKNPNGTLILSAGDMFQGSPDSNLLYGKTVVECMNTIGFDAMTLGNHEFDWGLDVLKQRMVESKFPYVAANIFYKANQKPISMVKPYVILVKNDLKIAVVGMATPETAYKASPKIVGDFDFMDPSVSLQKLWPELQQQKVDLVIALTHLSSFMDKDTGAITDDAVILAEKNPALAAVVSGHSHQIVWGNVNGIPLVQAGYNGRGVGKIDLVYKRSENKVILSSASVVSLPFAGLQANPMVKDVIEKSQGEIAPVKNVVVAKADMALTHDREVPEISILGMLTADIMKEAGKSQIAFQNSGGIRTSIPEGNVTMGNLYEVMPFDNTLVTMELTGAQVMEILNFGIYNPKNGMLQYSGLKVTYNSALPSGSRVVNAVLDDGSVLEPQKTYRVVTNDFMAVGGDDFNTFKNGKNILDTYIPLRDAMADAMKKMQTIQIEKDNRFIDVTPVAVSPAA